MIVYVDTSQVHGGALDELATALDELVAFVEASEPDILSYQAFLDRDRGRLTVVHVHRDSASLELHFDVAGPAFRRFVGLLTLESIDVYGEPGERVVRQLEDKARLLGRGTVTVHRPHAGFDRWPAGGERTVAR